MELTPDQLIQGIRRLPPEERQTLLRAILKDDIEEASQRFDKGLEKVHTANEGLSEDEVMDEVTDIVHQIRPEGFAKSGH